MYVMLWHVTRISNILETDTIALYLRSSIIDMYLHQLHMIVLSLLTGDWIRLLQAHVHPTDIGSRIFVKTVGSLPVFRFTHVKCLISSHFWRLQPLIVDPRQLAVLHWASYISLGILCSSIFRTNLQGQAVLWEMWLYAPGIAQSIAKVCLVMVRYFFCIMGNWPFL